MKTFEDDGNTIKKALLIQGFLLCILVKNYWSKLSFNDSPVGCL